MIQIILERLRNKLKVEKEKIFYYILNINLIKKIRLKLLFLIIKSKVERKYRSGGKLKIIVGASDDKQKVWIPTNIETLNLLNDNDWKNLFKENSLSAILAEHVWEHLTPEEGLGAFKRCYRYLKPGGYLRIALPDAYSIDQNYINMVKPGGYGKGANIHKSFYDYQNLSETLQSTGFIVNLLEYYDKNGQFINHPWQAEDGLIKRSVNFDPRNKNGKIGYTSLIIDAIKPE